MRFVEKNLTVGKDKKGLLVLQLVLKFVVNKNKGIECVNGCIILGNLIQCIKKNNLGFFLKDVFWKE